MKYIITISFFTIFSNFAFCEVSTPEVDQVVQQTTSWAVTALLNVLAIGALILGWSFVQKRFRDMSRHT